MCSLLGHKTDTAADSYPARRRGRVSPLLYKIRGMSHLRDAIERSWRSWKLPAGWPPSSGVPSRIADVHMWRIRDGWTSRIQAFRDEVGRTFALITRRNGDTGPGHINGAEMFRTDAWTEFFPDDQTPPILIANVLDPYMKFEDSPQIVTLDFDADGVFDRHYATDPADIRTLDRLGAEWDEGTGFVPYAPPSRRYAYVWRRVQVQDLPTRRLFRDMRTYMAADWAQAVAVAIQAIEANGDIFDEVPRHVAAAATTLLHEPVELARDAGKVWYVNGQHRTEAMLRQGVEEAVMLDKRLIDEPPLPGEIRRVGVS
jgi:hypothetical protein